MPLINLTTNLRNIRYGKDTPGGGYSGQPYIQKDIPVGLEPKSPDFLLRNGYLAPQTALTDVRRLTKMFFDLKSPNGLLFIAKQNLLSNSNVRTQAGGILNQGVYTPLSTLAQAGVVAFGGHLNKQGIDPTGLSPLSLITYLDVTNPKAGVAFSLKATGNNRLVNLADKKIKGNFIGPIFPSLVDNNISLLGGKTGNTMISYRGGPGAPLGVGFTNIDFADQRTGENNPLAQSIGADKAYFYGSYAKGGLLTLGRTGPVILHQAAPIRYNKEGASLAYERDVNKALSLINRASSAAALLGGIPIPFISSLNLNETLFGAGGTLRSERNVYKQGNTFPETNTEVIQQNGTTTYNQLQLIAAEPIGNRSGEFPKDFRKTIIETPEGQKLLGQPNNNLALAPDYVTGAIETRVHLGNPGTPKNKANYNTSPTPLDKITALPLYKASSVATNNMPDFPVNDLVKFRIAVIDNDNPQNKTFIHFRAFLDSISDNYASEWNSFKYTGRGENFYTYQGFTRDISLGWSVAAQSRAELIPMYKKLNYLASVCSPDYSDSGYMRGNLVQLTIGGYLYETVGIIRGFTYEMPQDATWEIGINTLGTGLDADRIQAAEGVKELSQLIRVTGFRFTPIQSFLPRTQILNFGELATKEDATLAPTQVQGYGLQRYISLSNGFNNNYTTAP
jgi:hypothetical protein